MSVKSTAFGSVELSGRDADKFRSQVAYGRPKQSAHESLKRGDEMLHEFERQGFVRIKRNK